MSVNSETVSIVVPVFNIREYLSECIESLVGQAYSNLEILLIDDGSTDGSGEICDEYAAKDHRVVVLHTQNSGLSVARNIGIKHATGTWLVCVDGDDVIASDFVAMLFGEAMRTGASVACCRYRAFSESKPRFGDRYGSTTGSIGTVVVSGEEAVNELLSEGRTSTAAWGKLAKIDLWRQIVFPAGRKFEDLPLTWKLLADADTVVLLGAELYFYRRRARSITVTPTVGALLDYVEAVDSLRKSVTASGLQDVREALSFRCCLEYCRILEWCLLLKMSGEVDGATVKWVFAGGRNLLRREAAMAVMNRKSPLRLRVRIGLVCLMPRIITLFTMLRFVRT